MKGERTVGEVSGARSAADPQLRKIVAPRDTERMIHARENKSTVMTEPTSCTSTVFIVPPMTKAKASLKG
jgi:hypothetical protein